jgi:hypothetical protein
MYFVMKIIYDSPVQEKLLSDDQLVLESILPKLVAFKSIMSIRDIQLRKANEIKKIKEKAELNGIPAAKIQKDPLHMTEEELVAWRLEQAEKGDNTGATKSEAQIAAEHEEKERKKYGRFWMWEGYFSDKNKEKWLQCAEALKHINDHVIQDIEDHILLEAFKGQNAKKIEQSIDNYYKEVVSNEKKLMAAGAEEFEQKSTSDNKKRKFMNEFRPHNDYWNFFEDCEVDKRVPH